MKDRARYITRAAMIAALYVALTLASAAMGLSSGVIQFRLSEALCVLPALTPAAVPGLFVGCAIANTATGSLPWDTVIGSLATLIGALLTRLFRRRSAFAPLFPVLSNALIIPLVLQYIYCFEGSYLYFFATVALGEIVCCGGLGTLLLRGLRRARLFEDDKGSSD